jgi:hypothetical protein
VIYARFNHFLLIPIKACIHSQVAIELRHSQRTISTMKDLERYIERIAASQTTEEAFDHFCAAMRERGYDRIAFSLVNDHPSLGLLSQHGLATSYPEDWMKHYAQHNFSSIDPVTRQVLTKRTPFFWSDVTSRLDRLSQPHQMMDQAADAGLGDGIGISLRGDVMAEGNVSAESSEKMISLAVADAPDVKPSPPGTAGNTVDQNRLKPCQGGRLGLRGELEPERKKEIPASGARHATFTA